MPALYLASMTVTAAPDTCPACGTRYALANAHGAYRCDECGNTWRVTPYSAWGCSLCQGATGKRVGRDREWVVCAGCAGTGLRTERRSRMSERCGQNSGGPHDWKREDFGRMKYKCQLCGHRK